MICFAFFEVNVERGVENKAQISFHDETGPLNFQFHGNYLVASAVGGVGELVVDGETGFLIEEPDPEAAERALARLLADGDLRRRMGEAGRRRAREKFSLGEMLRRYRDLYLS